jgi:NADH-quinone oxidoreductase subunit G
MATLTIDGIEVTVEAGATVLQACEKAGAEIPRFCYHERLSIAGNCRMCLVELEKSPKPIASCAMPAGEGMVIHTKTATVKKAREGVMEFLLINHPLDCPICDQGGECDLQDQAIGYGSGLSRYDEPKRAVKDKNMGPLISTTMTRCIHCMRCVRFATEVAGAEELGALGRGECSEVTTYLEGSLNSEMSGNVIDLCPVGALTSKPYAFTARSWELKKTETIDIMDAVGSNIRLDSRGNQIMRILPRLNEGINEEWISDKTRFHYDGLRKNRLDSVFVKGGGKVGKLKPSTWQDAFKAIKKAAKGVSGDGYGALIGDLADVEAMFSLKTLLAELGSKNIECRLDGSSGQTDARSSYVFNTSIGGIEHADACLLVGCDPRIEATLINSRLRKRVRAGGFEIANVGPKADLGYPVAELGNDFNFLAQVLVGTHKFSKILRDAKSPMVIIGQRALKGKNGVGVMAACLELAEKYGVVRDDWSGLNVLQHAASRVGALDLGLTNGGVENVLSDNTKIVFLLGADNVDADSLKGKFVVYLGSHGDAGASLADVVLPTASYAEKQATYINTEGRVQRTAQAIFPPGDAREDWSVVRALADVFGVDVGFNNMSELRAKLYDAYPHIKDEDVLATSDFKGFAGKAVMKMGAVTSIAAEIEANIGGYYMTNPICRSSDILHDVVANIAEQEKGSKAHG